MYLIAANVEHTSNVEDAGGLVDKGITLYTLNRWRQYFNTYGVNAQLKMKQQEVAPADRDNESRSSNFSRFLDQAESKLGKH